MSQNTVDYDARKRSCEELRRELTDAERLLWYRLRARRFFQCKFRRQVPIGPYVADFVCMQARLVVEVDGGQHAERTREDTRRDHFLQEHGFETVRFWNNEVLGNLDGVLQILAEVLEERGVPGPSP